MTNRDTHELTHGEILEIAIEVDSEAAEAVSELFNRYNGGDYDDDSEAGEASGGGAVIETTGYDDWANPIDGEFRMVVKTYVKPGERGREIRRQIEEGLWRLSVIYPMPEAQIRVLKEEDWAHAWKKFYKPFRIGKRVLLKPSWEDVEILPGDIVVELDPGMAFGTGMHPSTRLCIAGLEDTVTPGIDVLDIGTGSGVLAVAAVKLGARYVMATSTRFPLWRKRWAWGMPRTASASSSTRCRAASPAIFRSSSPIFWPKCWSSSSTPSMPIRR
jgi:ribosomal protein L11 methyltransferase